MKELQTILGTDIPVKCRAILYLCDLHFNVRKDEYEFRVIAERFYENSFDGLQAYANTPNPESQLITGEGFDDMIVNLQRTHQLFTNQNWLRQLSESI